MIPYSPESVATRARLHAEDVAKRDRLAIEAAKPNATYDTDLRLARAESDVTASLTRMEAMGDPLPQQVSVQPAPSAGNRFPPADCPPSAPDTLPPAKGADASQLSRDEAAEVDAIAKRIANA